MTRPSDPRWREQAQCTETDPEAFFPPVGVVPHAALRICAHCPVRTECLTDALARRDITYGVLGGLTPTKRRNLLRTHDTSTRRPRRAA
jgi:WhiB family redox-sensing transcriptional regulator